MTLRKAVLKKMIFSPLSVMKKRRNSKASIKKTAAKIPKLNAETDM